MNSSDIKEKIQTKYPGVYNNQRALDLLLKDVDSMDPKLQSSLIHFLDIGELHDIQVEGYSVATLSSEHGMNELASFLTLDWLIKEPEKAKASLAKGHDKVAFEPSSN